MEEPNDPVDRVAPALDDGLDRPVVTVADPAVDVVSARPLSSGVPEEHALDAAAHLHPLPDALVSHRKDSCKQAFPSATAAILD